MKRIKSFSLFESGFSYKYVQEIQIALKELLNGERFLPHIDEENRWIGGKRKFNIGVTANQSKFGIQYDVVFRTDDPVDPKLVNYEIRFVWRDIMDIIMDLSKVGGQVKLTKFNWFGKEGSAKKNGHTGEISDITDELVQAIELTDELPINYSPIYFQFTIV